MKNWNNGLRNQKEPKYSKKKNETGLPFHNEHFKSLLNNIKAAVVVHGADTNIIASNIEARILLGLTEDQMFGKKAIDSYWKFINPDGKKLPLEMYPVKDY